MIESAPMAGTNDLTLSFSGFGEGQGTNILSGSPSLNTTAETNSPMGFM